MKLLNMEQLRKIPSVVQIFIGEWLAVMFLFPMVSRLYERLRPSVGYQSQPLGTSDYVFAAIGLLLYLWLLREILRPRIKSDSWFNFKTASGSGGSYDFSSTHPSYVFIDLLACGFWWFVRWAWTGGWQERSFQGTILVVMALIIPFVRLLAWYVLGLRPKDEEGKVAEESRSAWRPVALLYILMLVIGGVTAAVVIPMQISESREQARKEASLTMLDASGWKGSETFEALRDPESNVDGQTATRVIRLHATQKGAAALTCTNDAGQGEFGTVLATLGGADDVMIFAYNDVTGLVERAKGNEGKTIEAMGRLTQMPEKPPTWKKYCGLEKLSPKPRWVFVEERP